jgi:hypothetical protein
VPFRRLYVVLAMDPDSSVFLGEPDFFAMILVGWGCFCLRAQSAGVRREHQASAGWEVQSGVQRAQTEHDARCCGVGGRRVRVG